MRDAEEKERALREEAWRQYWSGKRGEVKAFFDQFDLDSSGFISRREMELVLPLLGGEGFFGYADNVDSGDIDGMSAYVSDQLGEGGTGADALFMRLDTNQDDQISWDEVRVGRGRCRRKSCACSLVLPCASGLANPLTIHASHELPAIRLLARCSRSSDRLPRVLARSSGRS